jgi:protein-S-isoprenylcysteine O-methyltransferase Ste14
MVCWIEMSLDPKTRGGPTETTDRSNAVIRPPIAWALAFAAGLAVNWLYPLRWMPATWPKVWIGLMVFAVGLAPAIWAFVTFRRAGTRVEATEPTTAIVTHGPYRYTRNPIYVGMFLGQTGLAIGFDNLWILAMLIPFYLVLRYGVVAREEGYLERKFGDVYSDYKSRVRRWL